METVLLILLAIPFLVLKYLFSNHETPVEKDRRRFAEGLELVEERQFDAALAYFTLMAQQFPKSATVHHLKGRCNFGLQNYYSALYDLHVSLSLDNTNAEAYLLKGQCHFHLQEFNLAFLEFDKAVWHTRAQHPDALRWRGLARLTQGQTEQARQDFEKALALGDENAAFHLNTQFTRNGVRLRDFRNGSS